MDNPFNEAISILHHQLHLWGCVDSRPNYDLYPPEQRRIAERNEQSLWDAIQLLKLAGEGPLLKIKDVERDERLEYTEVVDKMVNLIIKARTTRLVEEKIGKL